MRPTVLYWRRLDEAGLEQLRLQPAKDGFTVEGTLVYLGAGGFRLSHRWRVSDDWRAQSVEVERIDGGGIRKLTVQRDGTGWRVDGEPRPDLDGAEEPDLSVTPFCNSLPIRRTPAAPGASHTLDVAYISAEEMVVKRSRQRYDRQGPRRVRYVDLGVALGFEADLTTDEDGLVLHYEQLFERVTPAA